MPGLDVGHLDVDFNLGGFEPIVFPAQPRGLAFVAQSRGLVFVAVRQ